MWLKVGGAGLKWEQLVESRRRGGWWVEMVLGESRWRWMKVGGGGWCWVEVGGVVVKLGRCVFNRLR